MNMNLGALQNDAIEVHHLLQINCPGNYLQEANNNDD